MGILNLTPDSFSDGGKFVDTNAALAHARHLLANGADVLDLGAESTRPGHAAIDAETELGRLLPVLKAVRAEFPEAPISVDTFKAEVAARALEAGADILNDIHGGRHRMASGRSPMCEIAARAGAPLILMHNRATPAPDPVFWDEFLGGLRQSVQLALTAGIPASQLWLDPGFGFGKTPAQNLECVRGLDRVKTLGFPVLLATSRKSTLGLVLSGAPVDARLEADKAVSAWGAALGADMLRVHDPAALRPVLDTINAIKSGLLWQKPPFPPPVPSGQPK
jgi:dihydropteroate synthase